MSTFEDFLAKHAIWLDAQLEELQIRLDAAKRENEELRNELEAAQGRINDFYVP